MVHGSKDTKFSEIFRSTPKIRNCWLLGHTLKHPHPPPPRYWSAKLGSKEWEGQLSITGPARGPGPGRASQQTDSTWVTPALARKPPSRELAPPRYSPGRMRLGLPPIPGQGGGECGAERPRRRDGRTLQRGAARRKTGHTATPRTGNCACDHAHASTRPLRACKHGRTHGRMHICDLKV